jgi:hypothetical protein
MYLGFPRIESLRDAIPESIRRRRNPYFQEPWTPWSRRFFKVIGGTDAAGVNVDGLNERIRVVSVYKKRTLQSRLIKLDAAE